MTSGPPDAAAPWGRVVIVNYNGGDYLVRAVAALARQSMADFEAVIVDNASSDGSADTLILPDWRFRLVRAGGNLGFAAGCNLGARGARRLPPIYVRAMVVAIGFTLSAYYFWKEFG